MKNKSIYTNYRIIFLLVVLIVIIATISSSSAASTIYVNNATGNDDYDGTSATVTGPTVGPKATIQNGSDTIDADGTVYVAGGTYKEHIIINKNLNILGQSQTGTIMDGTNNGRPLTINSGFTVIMTNFTIKNGKAPDAEPFGGSGGGIYNQGTLILTQCNIINNKAGNGEFGGDGGGIYNEGALTLNHCTITNNEAGERTSSYAVGGSGGGIFTAFASTLTINNSTLTENKAKYNGGALYNKWATVIITDSIIANNIAPNSGGGITNQATMGSLKIISSIITLNQAGVNGGGIFDDWGTLTVEETTFTNNTATYGGAVYHYGPSASVNFCRILENNNDQIYGQSEIDANNNWWSSNNPNFTTLISGNVLHNDWLQIILTANPNTIFNGETSNITADLLHDQDGVYHNPALGHVPDGILVNFASDALGTVSPLTGTIINGTASTTFKAGLITGISTITSTVDAATVTTGVTINENVPPVVTSTSPVNNALNVVVNKVIQINFDRNIQLGTNPWIEFKTSSSGTAVPYTTNIVGNVLSITPNSLLAVGTQYSVILHSNSVINLAGMGLAAPYTTRFTTETPPVVTSTNPVNNAFNVALNKVIQLTFDKAIQLGTNPWIEFKTSSSGTAVPFTTNIVGNVLSITPNSLMAAGTKYTVILHSNSITDMQGNGLNTPNTTIFTTTLQPVVTSTSPVNNATNVAVNKVIQINFSKNIQLGTDSWIEVKNQYGQAKPYTTSINGSTLNLTTNATFAKGTTYTVILHSNSVTSTGGAGLAAPYTTRFTTTTT